MFYSDDRETDRKKRVKRSRHEKCEEKKDYIGQWTEKKREGEGIKKGSKETLRESKRSEKHETRISLSITYALNPGIYASGINARARLSHRRYSSRLKVPTCRPPLYSIIRKILQHRACNRR